MGDVRGDAGVLDEAYERLHRTGPEFDGWLTNHGPMAVEAMARRGHAAQLHAWIDRYVRRLDDLPRGSQPITEDDWRSALGAPHRLGDWLSHFDRAITEAPWRAVLETWWPRLLPGIAAGATHGVIRTGHAVHALLRAESWSGSEISAGPRLAELGQALGYWAARWQPVPGAAAPSGDTGLADALAGVPRVADQSGGVNARLSRLTGVAGWSPALAALRPPANPDEARTEIAALADAATAQYLLNASGAAVMLVHAVTTPTAVLRTLPVLPRSMWPMSMAAAWAASAAMIAAYAPAEPDPRESLPPAPASPDEAFDRAVRHGDEHVIKLADTCLDVHERTADAGALTAVVRATDLITELWA